MKKYLRWTDSLEDLEIMEGCLVSDGNVSVVLVVDVSISINIIIIISMNFIIRNVTTLSLWEYLWSPRNFLSPDLAIKCQIISHLIFSYHLKTRDWWKTNHQCRGQEARGAASVTESWARSCDVTEPDSSDITQTRCHLLFSSAVEIWNNSESVTWSGGEAWLLAVRHTGRCEWRGTHWDRSFMQTNNLGKYFQFRNSLARNYGKWGFFDKWRTHSRNLLCP